MAAQTRATNKSKFEQGDKPQGSEYADLIDSFLSLSDTTAQSVTSTVDFAGAVTIAGSATFNGAVTAASIHVDGSSKFKSGITVSGVATFNSAITVLGNVTVSGGVAVSGKVSAGSGRVLMVQRTTVVQSNTAGAPALLVLPTGSDIIDFKVDVEEPFGTAAGVTAVAFRASAAAGSTFFEIPVSASGRYDLGDASTRGRAFRNVTATIEAHVSVQGSDTAMSAGQAMLSVVYV